MTEWKWRKSSFSEAAGNACVEVAATGDGVALRESDAPTEVLVVGESAMRGLIAGVKAESPGAPRR
ncbi:DUF397 domain-containing protein [Streptomyces natalensis]|uniref:DUF397 domain-containing protein n=1 Tax=Streptomyces natalensis ATCC 27448 TaxID=1240678 RepID=A0A0D7CF04_9ACTN|nr:DUF397 domain-containing protein [Streptomyces natalensis]KIZ14465.1 hypothetical protein SNA_35895 [Streptomyces natalensis ATCC 27448]